MNPASARNGPAFCRTGFRGLAAASSLRFADAYEDVGVPSRNFSPCLGVSVRSLRRETRCARLLKSKSKPLLVSKAHKY